MKNTYLVTVWKWDKKLAIGLIIFLLGQAFFTYKQVETLPFFNYGMYARPAASPPTYFIHYQLYNEQQEPVLLQEYPAATFLEYQLHFYATLQAQHPIDAPLKATIHRRFATFPSLETYLIQQLANDSSTLLHAQQWLEKKTEQNELSLWEENYVWVKDSFKLLTKSLVY